MEPIYIAKVGTPLQKALVDNFEAQKQLEGVLIRTKIKFIEEEVERLEKEYGKYESQSGSLGFQGIVAGIKSFQSPEDEMRDVQIHHLTTIKQTLLDELNN